MAHFAEEDQKTAEKYPDVDPSQNKKEYQFLPTTLPTQPKKTLSQLFVEGGIAAIEPALRVEAYGYYESIFRTQQSDIDKLRAQLSDYRYKIAQLQAAADAGRLYTLFHSIVGGEIE
jgi:hypothetical protein